MQFLNPLVLDKKSINIHGVNPSQPSGCPCGEVWVYTLDRHEVLGPYDLLNEETLQIPVDDREWGVYVEVTIVLGMDVWIDAGGS
jgi:hypothetical protein